VTVLDWARSVKPDLVALQQRSGIPALWAGAQFCHESAVDGGRDLSRLAKEHANYAGLKWAEWQVKYGCRPVHMRTWEVLNGQRADVTDAFCSCPDWWTWLRVYEVLLTGRLYQPALTHAADPLLYGLTVWTRGWATDPLYLVGVGRWMVELWADYADTLPAPPRQAVAIVDAAGQLLATGWLQDGQTVAPVRALAKALGLVVEWDPEQPSVTLRWPGMRKEG